MNISGLRLPARRTGAAAGAKRGSFDLPFFVLTLLLLAIGVIMVLSSSFLMRSRRRDLSMVRICSSSMTLSRDSPTLRALSSI